jgi:hypothetical protein
MLAVSIATAGAGGAATQGRILTVADATSALRDVGVTKTFVAPSAEWGPVILPNGGQLPAQSLIVRVFPNVAVAHSWSKANPPLSAAEVRGIVPGPYKFLPRLFACHVMVASLQLPPAIGSPVHEAAAIAREAPCRDPECAVTSRSEPPPPLRWLTNLSGASFANVRTLGCHSRTLAQAAV